MKAVVQRVHHASVSVDDQIIGQISTGLLAYIGIIEGDTDQQIQWMAKKLPALRIFPDDEGKMNRSLMDISGELLLIPNFTLGAKCKKGTRPNFMNAAAPEIAEKLFTDFIALCENQLTTATGSFGAHMIINAECYGPITLVVDTEE